MNSSIEKFVLVNEMFTFLYLALEHEQHKVIHRPLIIPNRLTTVADLKQSNL